MVNHGKRSDRDNAGDSLALIVNGDGKVTNRYLYGALVDEVLAEETLQYDANNNVTSEVLWALSDHQGSVRDWAKFGTEVSVVKHVDYDPFGNVIAPNPADAAIATMFGYTGRSTDPLTNLQDNHARDYDPTLGRFISQDPIGFDAGDANLFRYVGNHPSYATDPSGLWENPPYVGPSLAILNKHKNAGGLNYEVRTVSSFELDKLNRAGLVSEYAFMEAQAQFPMHSRVQVAVHPGLRKGVNAMEFEARAGGILEIVTAAPETIIGAFTPEVGGFILVGHGVDHLQAGIQSAWTGIKHDTYVSQSSQYVGVHAFA